MAENLPPTVRKLPIFPLPTTAYTTKTSKRRKSEEEKQAKKKELNRARDKTRINIGDAFHRWRELRENKGFKSDAELASFLLDRYCKLRNKKLKKWRLYGMKEQKDFRRISDLQRAIKRRRLSSGRGLPCASSNHPGAMGDTSQKEAGSDMATDIEASCSPAQIIVYVDE